MQSYYYGRNPWMTKLKWTGGILGGTLAAVGAWDLLHNRPRRQGYDAMLSKSHLGETVRRHGGYWTVFPPFPVSSQDKSQDYATNPYKTLGWGPLGITMIDEARLQKSTALDPTVYPNQVQASQVSEYAQAKAQGIIRRAGGRNTFEQELLKNTMGGIVSGEYLDAIAPQARRRSESYGTDHARNALEAANSYVKPMLSQYTYQDRDLYDGSAAKVNTRLKKLAPNPGTFDSYRLNQARPSR